MSIEGVTRELLVRYLDSWVPSALHARRATFAQSWPDAVDVEWAESVVRVFGEFADQMGRRRVTLVFIAPRLADIGKRLRALTQELGTPPDFGVHAVAGDAARLAPALAAAQAAGAPLLVCVDATAGRDATAGLDVAGLAPVLRSAKPPEVLVWSGTDAPDESAALRAAGLPLICRVDFVAGDAADRRLCFATAHASHLDAFKDALWQLDEYAGVSIRDPNDAEGKLLDIALSPPLGPLRRELTAYLTASGPRTVTELRQFAMSDTVYRAADATKALTAMLTAGTVTRIPESGRLSGDTVIRLATRPR